VVAVSSNLLQNYRFPPRAKTNTITAGPAKTISEAATN
jgi:hypothetical protein